MSSRHSDDEVAASHRPESPDQEQEQELVEEKAEEQEEEQQEEEMPRDSPGLPYDDPSYIRDDEPRGNPLTARRVQLKSKTARRATYQSAVSPGPNLEDDYAELQQQSSPSRAENINTRPDGGFINPDSARKKERRMKWTDKKDRELLLFGLGRDIAGNEYQAIADSFPEKPTAKAVQERLTKLRALTRKVLKKTGIYDAAVVRPPPSAPRRLSAPRTGTKPPATTPKQPKPARKPRTSKPSKPTEPSSSAGRPTPRPSEQPQQTPQPPNVSETPQPAPILSQSPQPASSVSQTPQQAAQPFPQPLPPRLSAASQPSMGMQNMQSHPIGSPQLGRLQMGTPSLSASQLAEYGRVPPFRSHLQRQHYQQYPPMYPYAGNAYTPLQHQQLSQAHQYNYVGQQFPDPLALPGQPPFALPRGLGHAGVTPRQSGPEMGGIIEEIEEETEALLHRTEEELEVMRAEEELEAIRAVRKPFR